MSAKAPEGETLDLVPLGLSEHDRAPLARLRAGLAEHEEALLVEIVRQRLADPRSRSLLLDPERDADLLESERRYLRSLWTDEARSMSHIELLGGLDSSAMQWP